MAGNDKVTERGMPRKADDESVGKWNLPSSDRPKTYIYGLLIGAVALILITGLIILATQTVRKARAQNIKQRGLNKALRTDANQNRKNFNATGRDFRMNRRQNLRLCKAECRGTKRRRPACIRACMQRNQQERGEIGLFNDSSSYLASSSD